MQTPKIIFRYSHIYDQNWRDWIKIYKNDNIVSPTPDQVQKFIKRIEPLWRKDEKKILTELSKITGLKWSDKFIYCYIVGRCRPFSDPLTIRVYKKPNRFIDILNHELIHQLFMQKGNYEYSRKAWNHIHKKYKNETFTTQIHIPLYAIYTQTYLKLYNKRRLLDEVRNTTYPEYKRALEIVGKEGYENIIKEFRDKNL
jgi:hypothetical protein